MTLPTNQLVVLCFFRPVYFLLFSSLCFHTVSICKLVVRELTGRLHCRPGAGWPASPAGRCWRPGRSRCGSGRTSTTARWRAPPASGTAARCWQSPLSDGGRVKDQVVSGWQLQLCLHSCAAGAQLQLYLWPRYSHQTRFKALTLCYWLNVGVWHHRHTDTHTPEPLGLTPSDLKDTALAWLMPTNTATQRITLDHSRLNLCGSPRRRSMQGYSRPIIAARRQSETNKRLRYNIQMASINLSLFHTKCFRWFTCFIYYRFYYFTNLAFSLFIASFLFVFHVWDLFSTFYTWLYCKWKSQWTSLWK